MKCNGKGQPGRLSSMRRVQTKKKHHLNAVRVRAFARHYYFLKLFWNFLSAQAQYHFLMVMDARSQVMHGSLISKLGPCVNLCLKAGPLLPLPDVIIHLEIPFLKHVSSPNDRIHRSLTASDSEVRHGASVSTSPPLVNDHASFICNFP